MAISLRAERPADRDAIFEVHARAFPTDAEARLVDRLRDAGAATISLVAERGGAIVGHICFSAVRVVGAGGAELRAIALAPVAVVPELQQEGIGGALIHAGLDACVEIGEPIVFVLGHPSYYPRFGFECASDYGFSYEGGPAFSPAFFVRELEPGALAGRGGVVRYDAAFAGL